LRAGRQACERPAKQGVRRSTMSAAEKSADTGYRKVNYDRIPWE
jgi:hypothetical protein